MCEWLQSTASKWWVGQLVKLVSLLTDLWGRGAEPFSQMWQPKVRHGDRHDSSAELVVLARPYLASSHGPSEACMAENWSKGYLHLFPVFSWCSVTFSVLPWHSPNFFPNGPTANCVDILNMYTSFCTADSFLNLYWITVWIMLILLVPILLKCIYLCSIHLSLQTREWRGILHWTWSPIQDVQ